MRTTFDRIRQALSFEVIGLMIVTPLFAWLFDHSLRETGSVALIGATIATLWNYIYNFGFDHALLRWRGDPCKTSAMRILHAVLFEMTLVALLFPVFAWWLGISLMDALLMDLAFAGFYMGYTFVFTWAYDTLYPPSLPAHRAA